MRNPPLPHYKYPRWSEISLARATSSAFPPLFFIALCSLALHVDKTKTARKKAEREGSGKGCESVSVRDEEEPARNDGLREGRGKGTKEQRA